MKRFLETLLVERMTAEKRLWTVVLGLSGAMFVLFAGHVLMIPALAGLLLSVKKIKKYGE